VRLWARDLVLVDSIRASGTNEQYLPGIALPNSVRTTNSLQEATEGAGCIVLAVPTNAIREVTREIKSLLPPNALIVSAAKGLEEQSGKRMSEVITEELGASAANRIVALSGPNLAVEVARGVPAATVAASSNPQAASECQAIWMGPTFRVYASSDLIGVELAGAMKNVIAIVAGLCEGLGYGDNSRAAIMTRGLAEITRLGVALGADPATFLGLAGVGDLIATGSSRLSRNYRVGVGLGHGMSLPDIVAELGQVAEGVPTTTAMRLVAAQHSVEMPITAALSRVLFEGAPVRDEISQLMMRPPKRESDLT
jgi:glycerol-3-phosphate dehydrogenase (NAD(P)+)